MRSDEDIKGKLSPVLYLLGVAAAFADPRFAGAIYLLRDADVARPGQAHRAGLGATTTVYGEEMT